MLRLHKSRVLCLLPFIWELQNLLQLPLHQSGLVLVLEKSLPCEDLLYIVEVQGEKHCRRWNTVVEEFLRLDYDYEDEDLFEDLFFLRKLFFLFAYLFHP